MEFDTLDDCTGLRIFDPIETARFELYTPGAIELDSVSAETFHFPVDTAVGFETTAVEIPKLVSTVVRRQDGEMLADATTSEIQTFEDGAYLIELQSTPMKLYLTVDGPLKIRPGETAVTVEFDSSRYIKVGARSFHERPVGTITVTDDIEDTITAISYLGSALKTTSCERSFPTLRGHPPEIERGDVLDIPDSIEKPDTGVEIVLPPDREYIYPIASLAYYLGAEIITGNEPRLVAGDFEYALDRPGGYEATVNQTLKQVFFLDCLTRTEGYYPVDLHERNQVEPLVDLDFETLYDQPIADQLPTYLSVDFETLEPHMLDWHLTTDILPVAENVPALPHFADELSLWRIPENPTEQSTTPGPENLEVDTRAVASGDFTRSTDDNWDWDKEIYNFESADTIEHAWVGTGYPIGVNKVMLDSLCRQADYTPPDDSALTVHVVCNDDAMADENVVSEFYGFRDFVTYDVTVHEQLTVEEFADLLESSADFLHYIGHVDDDGFRCTDDSLNAESLDSVGIEAFVLNACHSYEQGETLIEKGSRGGVVTLDKVPNASATVIGRALARLLNSGFSLRSALNIAKQEAVGAIEYVTLGDGGMTLCQSECGFPAKFCIDRRGGEYSISYETYPSSTHCLGGLVTFVAEDTTQYLISGPPDTFRVTKEGIRSILDVEFAPVEIDGELHWSNELSLSDL